MRKLFTCGGEGGGRSILLILGGEDIENRFTANPWDGSEIWEELARKAVPALAKRRLKFAPPSDGQGA